MTYAPTIIVFRDSGPHFSAIPLILGLWHTILSLLTVVPHGPPPRAFWIHKSNTTPQTIHTISDHPTEKQGKTDIQFKYLAVKYSVSIIRCLLEQQKVHSFPTLFVKPSPSTPYPHYRNCLHVHTGSTTVPSNNCYITHPIQLPFWVFPTQPTVWFSNFLLFIVSPPTISPKSSLPSLKYLIFEYISLPISSLCFFPKKINHRKTTHQLPWHRLYPHL